MECDSICDHIENDTSAVACGGVPYACEDTPCKILGSGACSDDGMNHLLTCASVGGFGVWNQVNDCGAMEKQCTKVTKPDGTKVITCQ